MLIENFSYFGKFSILNDTGSINLTRSTTELPNRRLGQDLNLRPRAKNAMIRIAVRNHIASPGFDPGTFAL